MTNLVSEIKKKVKFHSIIIAPEEIDFMDEHIKTRYESIIKTEKMKIGGVEQWTFDDKRRVIATKETGRLRNLAVQKELDIIEGDRLLKLLQEAAERQADKQSQEAASGGANT